MSFTSRESRRWTRARCTKKNRGFSIWLRAKSRRAVLVRDVFPYSVTNNPLTGDRPLAWLWRRLNQTSNRRGKSLLDWASLGLVTTRNMLQVLVSADSRYGPPTSFGVAKEIAQAVLRCGYTLDSRIPVILLGYSGGGQIAVGSAPYLRQILKCPVLVIGIGGVYSDDPGILAVDHLYQLAGTKDNVRRVGDIIFPGHWFLFPRSVWNRSATRRKNHDAGYGPHETLAQGRLFFALYQTQGRDLARRQDSQDDCRPGREAIRTPENAYRRIERWISLPISATWRHLPPRRCLLMPLDLPHCSRNRTRAGWRLGWFCWQEFRGCWETVLCSLSIACPPAALARPCWVGDLCLHLELVFWALSRLAHCNNPLQLDSNLCADMARCRRCVRTLAFWFPGLFALFRTIGAMDIADLEWAHFARPVASGDRHVVDERVHHCNGRLVGAANIGVVLARRDHSIHNRFWTRITGQPPELTFSDQSSALASELRERAKYP